MTEHLVEVPTGPRLCYRDEGEGEPLLLVAGLGQDLTAWPDPLVHGLVDRGFRVIRHDNRDAGRSTRMEAAPPSTWRQLLPGRGPTPTRCRTWPTTRSRCSTTWRSTAPTSWACRWAG